MNLNEGWHKDLRLWIPVGVGILTFVLTVACSYAVVRFQLESEHRFADTQTRSAILRDTSALISRINVLYGRKRYSAIAAARELLNSSPRERELIQRRAEERKYDLLVEQKNVESELGAVLTLAQVVYGPGLQGAVDSCLVCMNSRRDIPAIDESAYEEFSRADNLEEAYRKAVVSSHGPNELPPCTAEELSILNAMARDRNAPAR